MRTYGIFVKKDKKAEKIDDVLLIEEGVNFYAVIFNVFWFLFHGLWQVAALSCVMASLAIFMPLTLRFVFLSLLLLLSGLESNNILMYSLDRRGSYYFVGFSMGVDKQDAKLRFLNEVNSENHSNNNLIVKD
ncbi:MAG: DUF2628 domain-containing protein [Rickettsiales bacterium]|jgi:hypothetical protein|nr:DUF2628 domain-containing protein [Rickettsiales bacterium]